MGINLPGWQPRDWVAPLEPWSTGYDVLVVGGGLSGCAAAIAAGRRGANVALLEPTHMLGGQMTVGGVGTIDYAPGFSTSVEQGLWGEITSRIRTIYKAYGLTTRVARYRLNDSMGVNAPIGDRVLTELCDAAGVDVLRNCEVQAATITASGATLETTAGTLTASVAVEATEDGSLLALADFPYRAGNQIGQGTSLPGEPSNIQRFTQCGVLRRYDDGIPPQLRLLARPPDYDLYRPEILKSFPYREYYPPGTTKSTNDFAGYRAYPDIADRVYYDALDWPDIRRTSVNSSNDVAATTAWFTDTEARRAATTVALNKTLSIIWYLQNEVGLNWAVAQDEGFAEGPRLRSFGVTGGMPNWVTDFPVNVYLRESRRLVGAYALTAKRIARDPANTPAPWSSQALALGTYGIDMHGSKGPDDFEEEFDESAADVDITDWGPFPIPFGCFVPRDDRRLVAAEKNLSMSRIVSAAVRVHPSVTAVGEAAGVIAALAWKQRIAPRAVSYRAAQVSLLKRGALLLPYPIAGIPAGHRDYPAVSLAVLNKRVSFRVDNTSNSVRLSSSQLAAAKTIGAKLVASWKGPL